MTVRRHLLRPALLAALLFGALAAPAPGSVGGCGGSGGFETATDFCFRREAWICARRHARNELNDADTQGCVDGIEVMCSGISWPVDCDPPPSKLLTDACIDALQDVNRLDQDDRHFVECDVVGTLCGVGGGG